MEEVIEQTTRAVHAGSRHRVQPVSIDDSVSEVRGVCKSLVMAVGGDQFLHLIFIGDSLRSLAAHGFSSAPDPTDTELERIANHAELVRLSVEAQHRVEWGLTIFIGGHLGQDFGVVRPTPRGHWSDTLCRWRDLQILFENSDEHPVDRLLLLSEQESDDSANGLTISNPSGLLNLYEAWRGRCTLWIREAHYGEPFYLILATNSLLDLRIRARQKSDEHPELNVSGQYERVVNLNHSSIFAPLRAFNAYGSIERFRGGVPNFCISHRAGAVWVIGLTNPASPEIAYLGRQLWESLQLLLPRVLQHANYSFPDPSVEVVLDFRQLCSPQEAVENEALSESVERLRRRDRPIVRLVFGPAFLRHFTQVDNRGETRFLAEVIVALESLAGQAESHAEQVWDRAREILGGTSARVVHTLRGSDPAESLMGQKAKPHFEAPKERIKAVQAAVFRWRESSNRPVVLDRPSSREALNRAVKELMVTIQRELDQIDQRAMVQRLLFLHDTLLASRQQWRFSARAVTALYGDAGTAAALKADQENTQAAITLRALTEAAVCECSINKGRAPTDRDMDRLYAWMVVLIQLGRESEIIHHRLASEGITIYPDGSHQFEADRFVALGGPYSQDSFTASYQTAAGSYERWVLPRTEQAEEEGRLEDFEDQEFQKAFLAEYSLSFEAFQTIATVLIDMAVEAGLIVVSLSREAIRDLADKRGIAQPEVDAFLNAVTLPRRPHWPPTEGFRPSDIEPWRFGRRLSLLMRPVVGCNSAGADVFCFALGSFRQGITYLIDCLINGRLEKEFFTSNPMRSLIGKRTDARGRAFTQSVAEALKGLGWQTTTELKLTQLGAGKNPDLGDIDVLAWDETGRVLSIECKRLNEARTVTEIAQVCDRFAGTQGDKLDKHLRRREWLRNHPDALNKYIRRTGSIQLHAPMVTNAIVPFAYREVLPIPSSDIVQMQAIEEYVRSLAPALTAITP